MSEIKFISFTDVHISDINPQSRIGSYRDDILDKLKMIGNLGRKLNVDFYLCAGDLYNLKAPMRNSHLMNTMLIELFSSFSAPVYMIEGNHDLTNDSYENFDKQPLSVLYSSGALKRLSGRTVNFSKGEGTPISLELRGFPFAETPDLGQYPKANRSSVDVSVCALHLYATPEGGNLFKQKLFSYEEISQLNDNIFVLGHYHVDQGVVKTGDQHFINVGAVSRGSLSHDNIARIPKVCVVTCKKEKEEVLIDTQVVRLKVKPAAEVFLIEEKEKEEKKMLEAEAFVTQLREAIVDDNEIDTAEGYLGVLKDSKADIDKKVLEKVEYYINEADIALRDIKK
jgi:predicted phosphodiesterase